MSVLFTPFRVGAKRAAVGQRAERFDISLNWLICGEGYGLSPRLARNHGGKCNPPGNGTDQSQSTAISLKMARGRQSLAARLPVRG
jgi:hypothetical protein